MRGEKRVSQMDSNMAPKFGGNVKNVIAQISSFPI